VNELRDQVNTLENNVRNLTVEKSKLVSSIEEKRLAVEKAHAERDSVKQAYRAEIAATGDGSGRSVKRTRSQNGPEGGGADEMTELLTKMLRCSVCNTNFKDVVITRCFHMFCRSCTEKNLANRHRKCPACGDKFGADDVKAVYFS